MLPTLSKQPKKKKKSTLSKLLKNFIHIIQNIQKMLSALSKSTLFKQPKNIIDVIQITKKGFPQHLKAYLRYPNFQ